MKKFILVGAIIGLALGVLQLLVPYVIVKPCSIGSPVGACGGGTLEAVFYRGWPMANAGGLDIGYRYDQPPITWQIFANIAIIIAIAILVALVLYFASRQVRLSKTSSIVLVCALVLGLGISVAQVFYMQHETRQIPLFDISNTMPCEQKIPGCGYCPEAQKSGNFCNLGAQDTLLRGWPLKHETYAQLSHYDISPPLIFNAIIITSSTMFIAGLSLVALMIVRNTHK